MKNWERYWFNQAGCFNKDKRRLSDTKETLYKIKTICGAIALFALCLGLIALVFSFAG